MHGQQKIKIRGNVWEERAAQLYLPSEAEYVPWSPFPSQAVWNPLLESCACVQCCGLVCEFKMSYLLTPWSRVHLEKLTGSQLVKNFPTFYGTRRFITAFTSAHHLSISWVSSIQSIPPHPTFWRSILILSSHLRLGLSSGHFLSGYPTKTLYTPLLSPIPATCPAHLILLDFITRTTLGEQYHHQSSSVICQTTGPKPLPKRFLHTVRSRASSFNWQYPLLSLRSSSSSSCHFYLPLYLSFNNLL